MAIHSSLKKKKITINNDPWEAYNDIDEHGSLQLSNIEFTFDFM